MDIGVDCRPEQLITTERHHLATCRGRRIGITTIPAPRRQRRHAFGRHRLHKKPLPEIKPYIPCSRGR